DAGLLEQLVAVADHRVHVGARIAGRMDRAAAARGDPPRIVAHHHGELGAADIEAEPHAAALPRRSPRPGQAGQTRRNNSELRVNAKSIAQLQELACPADTNQRETESLRLELRTPLGRELG